MTGDHSLYVSAETSVELSRRLDRTYVCKVSVGGSDKRSIDSTVRIASCVCADSIIWIRTGCTVRLAILALSHSFPHSNHLACQTTPTTRHTSSTPLSPHNQPPAPHSPHYPATLDESTQSTTPTRHSHRHSHYHHSHTQPTPAPHAACRTCTTAVG